MVKYSSSQHRDQQVRLAYVCDEARQDAQATRVEEARSANSDVTVASEVRRAGQEQPVRGGRRPERRIDNRGSLLIVDLDDALCWHTLSPSAAIGLMQWPETIRQKDEDEQMVACLSAYNTV